MLDLFHWLLVWGSYKFNTDKPLESLLSTAVCVFAYKRPNHLKQVLDSLASNPEAASLPLIVYVDGPRGELDQAAVTEVAKVAKLAAGFLSVEVQIRTKNLGLYQSLTFGISEVLAKYESIIVLEDDIQTSPYFLKYMLDGLSIYRESSSVASISGYTPPIRQDLPETFFLRGADCWGWATWSDRWSLYRHDATVMAQEIRDRDLVHEFDLLGNYPYLEMLDHKASGKNNSWAICWHASCFLAEKLILYPGRSLVMNIGLDNSGEHCGPSSLLSAKIDKESPVKVNRIPLMVDPVILNLYSSHFSRSNHRLKRASNFFRMNVKRILRSLFSQHSADLLLAGPYPTFEAALAHSSGYDSPLILAKVKEAVLDVLEGRAVYERDGTVFQSMPKGLILRELLVKYLGPEAHVVDFGGGLGGTYINHRDLAEEGQRWSIIEQSNFVKVGQELADDYHLPLKFYCNLSEIDLPIDILILSSVLSYLPAPYDILKQAFCLAPKYILIDRMALIDKGEELWWVQEESAYYGEEISYPNCPLLENKLLAALPGYRLVDRWLNPFDPKQPTHRGLLLSRCC